MADDRLAVQAAIKRATFTAQREMDSLDADVLAELEKLYKQAAADLKERIAGFAGGDGNLSLAQLQDVLRQVNARLVALSDARDRLLQAGMQQAAGLGVQPLTAAGLGVNIAPIIDSYAAMQVSDEALRFVRTFIAEDGLQLSDRIWRLDRQARELVTNAIEQAVIQGYGAGQAARELLMRGQQVPIDLQSKLDAANAAKIAKEASMHLMTGNGSPLENAMRVMRTELNRAHGEAYMAGGEKHPDFGGWRFLLSPAHPAPDICDLHSAANLHGLGRGVYPSREKCPWPAHPNTLSYVEIVFKDEVTEADKAGKETPMAALARLTPAQQRGVLGVHKHEAFKEGRLTQGMIKAPWSKVKTRIARDIMPDMTPAPDRSPWQGFPDVLIHADESTVKQHAFYENAKAGDIVSARQLVLDTYSQDAIGNMRRIVGDAKPIVVAVSAIEEMGENVIPTALAGVVARKLDLPLDSDIVQINKVSHTGAKGDYRLATPALFDGAVERGASYLLVDDFIGQGGTLANLRGFIERAGGRVLLATTLTGKPHSAKLALSSETLKQLRDKHGSDLEKWWKARYGYGFEFLTESEARYLARIEDADQIRNRILAAAQAGE